MAGVPNPWPMACASGAVPVPLRAHSPTNMSVIMLGLVSWSGINKAFHLSSDSKTSLSEIKKWAKAPHSSVYLQIGLIY